MSTQPPWRTPLLSTLTEAGDAAGKLPNPAEVTFTGGTSLGS